MAQIKTLYNADCPVCNFEITHYADYSKAQNLPLSFEDLNTADLAQWGLTKDQAQRRMYVLYQDEMHGGIDGFLILWAHMPRYRWLGRIVGIPGIKQVAAFLYDYVAAPIIYRWALQRQARANRNAAG